MSYQLKYGQVRGGEQGFMAPIAASQTILAASAKFVVMSSGVATLISGEPSTQVLLGGHLECEAIPNSVNTGTSTGKEIRKIVNDPTAVYRIPIVAGTFTAALVGTRCDLGVVSSVIGADLSSTSYKQFIIMAGDLDDNQWVEGRIDPEMLDPN